MSQQFQFLDIIFLGIVVLLLINRLRSVLGTRPSSDDPVKNETGQPSKVVNISEYRTLESTTGSKMEQDIEASTNFEENAEVVQNLRKIKEAFPSFDLVDFMQKAPRAFEYIALAFAKGDKESLKPLLSANIYQSFEKAIDERQERHETADFSLISFKTIKLIQAEMFGNEVELTVEFETEQTNIIKNAEGEVIVGDPTYIETVTDIWTLKKNMRSSDPVWVLTATHSK
ncbi:MAG: Tim44 domain-containing protein [Alphaproteobacteria bacterium]|nr:Tim44 domain-containing protein [Alphaproteobacteria bacterium]